MKKIFAIALALVMVFSMASAFAMNCLTFDYSKTTKCGTGKVEVIPYVMCNGANGTNTFSVSECADAVNNLPVFYAVKVTVEANPNAQWWAAAELEIEYVGLNDSVNGTYVKYQDLDDAVKAAAFGKLSAGDYYLVDDGTSWGFVKAADFVANAAFLFDAAVTDADRAKLTATLGSEKYVVYNGTPTDAIELNGYDVYTDAADAKDKDFSIFFGTTEVEVVGGVVTNVVIDGKVYSSFCGNYYVGKNAAGENITAYADCGTDYKTIADIFANFGLSFGMKLNGGDVVGTLGWSMWPYDDATWGAKSCAIVNADCVVAIPKTGDVSVVAYAVMAVVAAAGAMLKK